MAEEYLILRFQDEHSKMKAKGKHSQVITCQEVTIPISTRANPSSNTIYECDDNQASEGKLITLTPQNFITGWLQYQTIFLMKGVKMT